MRKSHKFDELTAIEETSKIPSDHSVGDLFPPPPPRGRKGKTSEVQGNNMKLPTIEEQPSLTQGNLKEMPTTAGQQMVLTAVASNNKNILQPQQITVPQHTESTQQQQPMQQPQQPIAVAAAFEQAGGSSYIQPLFTTPYGVPYPMQVAAPVTIPAAATNTEHTSFLRHVLGQKMSAVPGTLEYDQQQQDPNALCTIHYDQQQQQQAPSGVSNNQQPQQSYAPH